MSLKIKAAICCIFFFRLGNIYAFKTAKCDHENLTKAIREVSNCLEDEKDHQDVCSPFQEAADCVTIHLEECFEKENVEVIKKNVLGGIRRVLTQLSNNPAFYELYSKREVIYSLFYLCPGIPDRDYTNNLKRFQFISMEESVATDNNCTIEQKSKISDEIDTCFTTETAKVKTLLTRRLSGNHESFQSRVCSILERTVGKCWSTKPLDDCRSEREQDFHDTERLRSLNSHFKAVGHFKVVGLSFSSCPLFSGAKNIASPTTRDPLSFCSVQCQEELLSHAMTQAEAVINSNNIIQPPSLVPLSLLTGFIVIKT